MTTPNIVITGFMGTGKSTVGPLLAERLDRPFIDLDTEIEKRAGTSIADIFADEGEPRFREFEAITAAELAQQNGQVIATGGGALLAGTTRRVLAENGIIIELRAALGTLIERLRETKERPLLDTPDWESRLARLYHQRRATYDRLPYSVDTTQRTPDEVVDAILGLTETAETGLRVSDEPQVLPVEGPNNTYEIVVGADAVSGLGRRLRALGFLGNVAIITDTNVGPLHSAAVRADSMAAGVRAEVIEMPAGERHKHMGTVGALHTELLTRGFDRSSVVVALGGGVVGDVAGFVAATYMRGVPLVQMPTSLLAMVDSSVGGKVGVDHADAKNLIGAFKQPASVVADTLFLETLPAREIRNGLAEVIKHGIIGAPALLERLEAGDRDWNTIVPQAVQVKIEVVEEDPFERGRRAVLNLGHTFGHALEVVSDFQLAHGEAVAIGLVQACDLAVRMGLAEETLRERVKTLLEDIGLPTSYDADPDAVWEAMQRDKKKKGRQLRFIVPRAVGDVIVTAEAAEADVRAVLATNI